MNLAVQYKIKNNPNLYKYLRENSHWYKALNRDPFNITLLDTEMKKKYQLSTSDKISKVASQIKLIKSFMDIVK
ncbi:MAG: YlbE-like family protein [Bacilli bacterium]